jgi:DNA-binding transcriptional MerR regulator
MNQSMSIGELAAAAGVPVSTVRFYERQKLLRPIARTSSNYRLYDDASLDRLKFIRTAVGTGLSLDDVSQLLKLDEGTTCTAVQSMLADRLLETDRQLADLRTVQRALREAIRRCCESEEAGICRDIVRLKNSGKRS